MARFLFTVWPFAGHIHPAVAVAHGLRVKGHEIAFYTGGSVRSTLEAEGFGFFPFVHLDEERVARLAASEFPYQPSAWRRLRGARRLQARFEEWLLGTIPRQMEDLNAVLRDWEPDAIVCDLAFWGPILVLHEARGLPVAVLSVLAACILPGRDVPVWGQGAPRPRNAMMRLRGQAGRRLLHWLSAGFRAKVNTLRRGYGLPPIPGSVTGHAAQMPLYIVPSIREYDYERRDLPPSVHFVGACLWDRPKHTPLPAWIPQLPRDQPLVYVTEATIGSAEPFLLNTAAAALKDLPVQVVMTTGKQRDPAELQFDAPNVRVEAYVPQSELLPLASVMVTLGGSGGVLAALSAGVPLVIVPTEWDRPENAQRVVEAGAGMRLAPHRCTPERLRAAVERVLNEPQFRANAQRLARSFARYDGPQRAAELLEQLVVAVPAQPRLREGVC